MTATPIWTLSIINRKLGLNEEALKDGEKAAEILKSSLGPSHWRYAVTIRGEAEVLIKMNRFKEAKKKIDEAMEIINTHYPSNAVFKGHFNATYPNIYIGLNNLDKAAEYYSKSISFFKEGMGETHPKVAEILLSCAKMEMGRENYNKAHSLLKEAFQIQKHNEQSDEELEATKKLIAECKKKANYSATKSTD